MLALKTKINTLLTGCKSKFNTWFSKKDNKKIAKKKAEKTSPSQPVMCEPGSDAYFERASAWDADQFASLRTHKEYWRLGCVISVVFLALSIVIIAMMIPLRQYIPVLVSTTIHKDGTSSSDVTIANKIPMPTLAMMKSDLANYVRSYESYLPDASYMLYEDVWSRSSPKVFTVYHHMVDPSSPNSLSKTLKDKTRSVAIEKVDLQLKNPHQPVSLANRDMARIEFTMTTTDQNGAEDTKSYSAFLSWDYLGIPSNQTIRTLNWSGFRVTSFNVMAVNFK